MYSATQCSPGLSLESVLHTSRRGLLGGSFIGSLLIGNTPINARPHLFANSCLIFVASILTRIVVDYIFISVQFQNVFEFGVHYDVDGVCKSRSKLDIYSDRAVLQ